MPAFFARRSVLLVTLLVAALLAGLSGYALTNAGDEGSPQLTLPTAGPSPTLSSTPKATPSTTPSPTATASPAPTETSTSTHRPTATPHSTRTSSGGSGTYAYPKPSRRYDGLRLTGQFTGKNVTVGDPYKVSAVATDGDGTIYFTGLDWGDGSKVPGQASPQHCKSYPPLHSPPGPYQPQPDKKNFGPFNHTYVTPGTYTIIVKVASVNADCRPNGPKPEATSVALKVTVTAPAPSPSPAP